MAITFGNPIILPAGTEMATSYKTQLAAAAPGAGINNTSYGTLVTFKVTKIYWENPGAIGDTVSFGDPQSGKVLLLLRCEVAAQSQLLDFTSSPLLWSDFEVTQTGTGTGTIYIYNSHG